MNENVKYYAKRFFDEENSNCKISEKDVPSITSTIKFLL
jgi:hypothetical protein